MYELGADIELWPIAAEYANFLLNGTPTRQMNLKCLMNAGLSMYQTSVK